MNSSSAELTRQPVICISGGDPAGIGPEIIVRALAEKQLCSSAKWIITGSEFVLRRTLNALATDLEYTVYRKIIPDGTDLPRVSLLDVQACAEIPDIGQPSRAGGLWAANAITAAVELVLKGTADALVTAPISKKHLISAGYDHPGHTEMIASMCGVKKPVMVLVSKELRVAVLTRHIPLKMVFMHLTKSALTDALATISRELSHWFGITKPRIAVTGVNPHCGEEGLIGSEEQTIIAPAIASAKRRGLNCTGPFPADTVFSPAMRKDFDCILAIYHDQGLAPFKALCFDSGVNITLNLPFPRTSPDHGTAFDIAPQYKASSNSMTEAINLAIEMSGRK